MSEIARHWRVLAVGIGATAVGAAGVLDDDESPMRLIERGSPADGME
ncbi:MAG: hypothetical protein WBB57_03780 [Mycobacterium sp.]